MKTCWVNSSLAATISALLSTSALSQSDDSQNEADVEKITVHGMHRVYQGSFEYKEVPAAAQDIDLGLLSDAGAINLNDALDLSASVARQNNFGGRQTLFIDTDQALLSPFKRYRNFETGYLV